MMLRKLIIFSFILLSCHCFLKADDTVKFRTFHYIAIKSGFGHSSYRDMGVSPLVYAGGMPFFSLGHRATRPAFIFDTYASFLTGNYLRKGDGMTYKTKAYNLHIHQNYYRNIHSSNDNLLFFMGGGFSGDFSARYSPHYMNAQFVLNKIFNLSLTGRMQFNFSLPEREGKILFLKCRRPQRNYVFAVNAGIPFASIGHYPGFSYVSHGTLNKDNEFENYKWHLHIFTGINAQFEFLRFLENGNAHGLTYHFQIFSSKGYLNNYLQFAEQAASVSLFYRFK